MTYIFMNLYIKLTYLLDWIIKHDNITIFFSGYKIIVLIILIILVLYRSYRPSIWFVDYVFAEKYILEQLKCVK